jgi:hypothetical protein
MCCPSAVHPQRILGTRSRLQSRDGVYPICLRGTSVGEHDICGCLCLLQGPLVGDGPCKIKNSAIFWVAENPHLYLRGLESRS